MAYLGIQTQINRNNRNSVLLLITFPLLVLAMVFAFLFITLADKQQVGVAFMQTVPVVIIIVGIWFVIAFFANTKMIQYATGSKPLSRTENMRVYNLVENLCISQGMTMPQVFVIEDSSLNAFASGINEKNYAVTLSRGIIDKLDDDELEGVIAHELTHILNKDVRLLIISIVFVGIFAFLAQIAFRRVFYAGMGRKNRNNNAIVLIAMIAITAIAYFISMIIRFSISRSREYMADAGAAEMTRNPLALASALRKISQNSTIDAVNNDAVAQLFIDHPIKKKKSSFSMQNLFATHPPIEKRIQILEDF